MTTTGPRTRRRLAVVLAGALALGGLVALAPTATAAQTGAPVAQTGVATWGISDLLGTGRPGFPSPAATPYLAPATYDGTTKLSTWGDGTGTVNPDGSATLAFKGTAIEWATTGNAYLRIADLETTFDADGDGSVSALVSYGTTTGGSWPSAVDIAAPTRVTIVDLASTDADPASYPDALENLPYSFSATATNYSWSGLTGRWSNAFLAFLAGNHPTVPAPNGCQSLPSTCWAYASTIINGAATSGSTNGVLRWPAEFKFSIDRTVAATTAAASIDGDGVKIAVAGTGFLKTSPGVYVSLRERTPGDAAYAGGSVTPDLGTAWVSNDAADIGPDPATGAGAAINDDGSFSVDVNLNAAAVDKLDPTKTYTIVTRKAHGQGTLPAHASQVTEIPVDLAALKQTTTVAAPNVTVAAGATATVNATVTPATSGTPTGTVVLKDGDVTVGTGTLAGGTTAINVPGLAAGSKSYALRYSGANGYWKSAGSVTITVAKNASAITVTGPASVAYRTAATYTVNVSNGATGTVVVTGAGVTYNRAISAGKATFVLPATLAAGVRTLKFAYAGDANTNAATTVGKTITIAKGATAISAVVTSKWTSTKAGKLTVTIKSVKGGPVPVGKVTLTLKKGAATKTLAAKVLAGGKVVFTLPKSAKGKWSVKATYRGSTQHTAVAKTWFVTVK